MEFQQNPNGFPAVISPAGIPLLFHWNNSGIPAGFHIFPLEFEGTPVEFRGFVPENFVSVCNWIPLENRETFPDCIPSECW